MAVMVDTNVLVYFFDQNEPIRQRVAIATVQALSRSGQGNISAQCLAEFSNIALKRLKPKLTPDEAITHVRDFAKEFTVIPLTEKIVEEALRGVRDYQFSYYDAQIWAAARLHQIPVVFSEDFNPGVYDNVRIVNPFDATFNLREWA